MKRPSDNLIVRRFFAGTVVLCCHPSLSETLEAYKKRYTLARTNRTYPQAVLLRTLVAMEHIRGRKGQVVRWRRGNELYHLSGTHAGVVNGTNDYGHRGQQLGVFENCNSRDHHGGVVAFMRGATGTLAQPVPCISPVPPVLSVAPVPSNPSIQRVPAVPSLGRGQEWQQFNYG